MCAENDFYVAFDSFNSSDSDPARTRERRKEDVITQVACGDEEAFLKALREDNTGELEVRGDESRPDKTGEDVIRILIAKAEWLGLHPNEDTCSVDEAIAYPGRPPSLDVSAAIFNRFDNHAECTGYRRASKRTLQRACLKYQINAVIRWINQGRRQPGSDDLPCIRVGEDLIGTLDDLFRLKPKQPLSGDWDVTIRDLIRLYEIDARSGHRILEEEDVRPKILHTLFSIDGGPSQESYSVFQCGNQERSTGSADERRDEKSFLEELWDKSFLSDLFDWFWKRRHFLALAFVAVAALSYAAGYLGTLLGTAIGAAAVAAGVAVALIATVRIPETENHLLMINSSKYIINKHLIAEATDRATIAEYTNAQDATEEWLLKKMQLLIQNDFVEYNSRPYQRYSLLALLNLHDFSGSERL